LNFDRIDRLLNEWQQKAAMVSQNLLELHDMSAYQRLSDLQVRQQLPSLIQQQVDQAIEQVDRLFEYFELLRDALKQAKDLRKQAGTFGSDNLLPKIENLLTSEWIVINQQQIPLAQRGLLSPLMAGELLSLDRLLEIMTGLFEAAVATFTEIERTEQNVAQDLQTARHSLQEIQALHLMTSNTYQEATEKCGESDQKLINPSEIITLADWLKNLETKFSQGAVQNVAIALQNWLVKAEQIRQITQDSLDYQRGRLQLRLELRGRLLALKSKAVAKRRSEDPILINIAQQAEALLHRRPTPLDVAADLVMQYEKRLNGNFEQN
jgi:predicted translin family RNA/ssDNA-binding protein